MITGNLSRQHSDVTSLYNMFMLGAYYLVVAFVVSL